MATEAPAVDVPRWLDLDELVPVEVRERLAALAEEGTTLEAAVRDFAVRAWNSMADYNEAVSAGTASTRADVREWLDPITGYDRLWLVVQAIVDHTGCITECEGGNPDWLTEEQAKRGLSTAVDVA